LIVCDEFACFVRSVRLQSYADFLAGTAGVIICWVVGEPSKLEGRRKWSPAGLSLRSQASAVPSSRAVGRETLKLPRTLCDEAEVEG
jgi:hypothetical protein